MAMAKIEMLEKQIAALKYDLDLAKNGEWTEESEFYNKLMASGQIKDIKVPGQDEPKEVKMKTFPALTLVAEDDSVTRNYNRQVDGPDDFEIEHKVCLDQISAVILSISFCRNQIFGM